MLHSLSWLVNFSKGGNMKTLPIGPIVSRLPQGPQKTERAENK